MSGLLWTKWYFPDWMNDPGIRASSLAARGLWKDMLCLAAQHEPPGYVAINGNPLSPDTLARMVGASVQDVESLLAELERNGVFSRNRNGVIFSRRMVRETKKSKIARENGKKGGNPSLSKEMVFSASDNPPLNPRLNPLSGIKPRANKPEDRDNTTPLVQEAPPGRGQEPDLSKVRTRFDEDLFRRLTALTTGHPVCQNFDISPIQRLADAGTSMADIEAGVMTALAKGDAATRWVNWRQFVGWISRIEADRKREVDARKAEPERRKQNDPNYFDVAASIERETLIARNSIAAWLKGYDWNSRCCNYPPDHPHCDVPAGILAEFGLTKGQPVERPATPQRMTS